jgi:hypothetical protein
VLSASRRTDLVSAYPDSLCDRLQDYPPDRVHSLVIWTKNPRNLFEHDRLRECLAGYAQRYVHLTITGLGASVLEPGIPPWAEVAAMLPQLIDFAGGPQRVSWRFDPIVRVRQQGRVITNSELFPELAAVIGPLGIPTCRTSWVEPYRKVVRRMERRGFTLLVHAPQERRDQAACLQETAAAHGIEMLFCSMEGFARSRCIDGALLNRLHPGGRICSERRATGQRRLCGCTESIDIGWYSLKCASGCLYCYAEPLVDKV